MQDTTPPIGRTRILYVDDSRLDRELVRHALVDEDGGFEVIEAASKDEFLERLREGTYDLVLSDFNILGFEGLEVMDEVKAYDAKIPVVIVTGTGSEEGAVAAMKRGAADYVIKTPQHIRKLPHTISKALEKQRTDEARLQAQQEITYHANLLQNVSDAIISTDIGLRIESWNRAAEKIYGWRFEEVKGMQVEDVVQTEYSEASMEGVADGGRTEPGSWRGEVVQRHRDGSRIPILASVSPIYDEEGGNAGWVSVNRDIKLRKQAEEALRLSETRYRTMFESVPDAVLVIDDEQIIREANPAACALYGYALAELKDQPIRQVVHTNVQHLILQAQHSERSGQTIVAEMVDFKRDGTPFEAEVRFKPFVLYAETPYVLVLVRDITERKRLEKEILEISEREKRRIGRDLHDELGQILAGIGFRVAELERDLEDLRVPEVTKAEEIGTMIQGAIQQTRTLARGLNPINLMIQGFAPTLQEYVRKVESIYGLNCSFNCPVPILVEDPNVATHVYRILQEGINNAIRHGHADQLAIDLNQVEAAATLVLKDNGQGLPEDRKPTKGMGLRIMDYRARMINGSFDIRNAPEGGAIMTCTFPVPQL